METVLDASKTLAAVHPQLSAEHRGVLQQLVESYADPSTAARFFQAWDGAAAGGLSAEECLARARRFFDTLLAFNASYAGGIKSYVSKAQVLLEQSRSQYNPLVEEWTPGVPAGAILGFGAADPAFAQLEEMGLAALQNAAFVLVAGGRGERLGYDGIKVSLPVQLLTGATYLQHFIESILGFQRAVSAPAAAAAAPAARGPVASSEAHPVSGGARAIPLVIMTSADTHADTVKLLAEHGHFGAAPGQVTLVQQDLVPSLLDNAGTLATVAGDPFTLAMKPHGHGDVHALLHSHGLVKQWAAEGRQHVVFFQDTQALFVKVVAAAVGYAVEQKLDMSTVTVPRRAGDAVGALVRLQNKAEPSHSLTANVEYNQLGGLMAANGKADTNDEDTGYSPFPGNTNQLILGLDAYLATLERTDGVVAEFVNPKYADAARTVFKKATRLECMMQDIAMALPRGAAIGFTTFPPLTYSPVKNDVQSAINNVAAGKTAACAITGEVDVYGANCALLAGLGVNVGDPAADWPETKWRWDLSVRLPPKVLWPASFAVTTAGLQRAFPEPSKVSITPRSTLLLTGDCSGVVIRSLKLDGTLVIHGAPGVIIELCDADVTNDGLWALQALPDEALANQPTFLRMRGFRLQRQEGAVVLDATNAAPGTTKQFRGSVPAGVAKI